MEPKINTGDSDEPIKDRIGHVGMSKSSALQLLATMGALGNAPFIIMSDEQHYHKPKPKDDSRSGEWTPYQEIDFSDPGHRITCYHVDTRDFHCKANSHTKNLFTPKLRKYPEKYFHTAEEVRALLDRLFNDSGGHGEWRMLSLEDEAKFRTSGWQLKYIHLFRYGGNLFLVTNEDDFVFSKQMLACPVNQTLLHKK